MLVPDHVGSKRAVARALVRFGHQTHPQPVGEAPVRVARVVTPTTPEGMPWSYPSVSPAPSSVGESKGAGRHVTAPRRSFAAAGRATALVALVALVALASPAMCLGSRRQESGISQGDAPVLKVVEAMYVEAIGEGIDALEILVPDQLHRVLVRQCSCGHISH